MIRGAVGVHICRASTASQVRWLADTDLAPHARQSAAATL